MKVVYSWLKEYVGDEMPELAKLDELFTFHAFEIDGIEKVNGHDVIDVKVLPDRASDCLSHRGIARELSTIVGKPLAKDPLKELVTLTPKTEKIKVTIENNKNCRRFAGVYISGVTVKESPEWLKERLQALGQRSINNVVDATNYVMLALGQPLHAYDTDKFVSNDDVWHFGVRMAREGEEVTTLSGDTIVLKDDVQLIVNGLTDIPVGIAGIKGGKSAEINFETTSIILEAANFNPSVTRRASQSIRLQTDASKRFENNISPELVPYALKECVDLIHDIAGGDCGGFVDEYPTVQKNATVAVSHTQIESLLGISVSEEAVTDIFRRLGFNFVVGEGIYEVIAPFERMDIVIAEDVIAEVGRIYGYEHIKSIVPTPVPLVEINARHYYSEKIRDILTGEGFSEVITSSFRKKDVIELQNALASDKGCLRSSLQENIREVLDRNMPNVDLLGVSSIRVFEIGTAFEKTPDGSDVTEHVSLAIGVRQKQQGYSPKDDAELSRVVEILEVTLGVSLNGALVKGVYECDLTALLTKLPAPTKYDAYKKGNDVPFKAYSSYPFISRDIALWTPEGTSAHDIELLLRDRAGELLIRPSLFDEFKKDGRISYAFRLVFQSFDRTLTDEEINVIMESIYTEMKGRGFEVR